MEQKKAEGAFELFG